MNHKGYSWPETVLTLTILMIIFGTLLPLATNMTSMLQEKKLAMHAAETAYHGVIVYDAYEVAEGNRQIDGIDYDWRVSGNSICVLYRGLTSEVTAKCIDF